MNFVAVLAVADVLVGEGVAFVALTADADGEIVGGIGPKNRVVEVADGEIIRPPLGHGAGLDVVQATGTAAAAHEAVADAMTVLVEHDLPVVVGVEIVGQAAGAAVEKTDANVRRSAVGHGLEGGVVDFEGLLRLADHGVVTLSALAEVVGLEVAGGFGETQAIVEVVSEVDEVEEAGYSGRHVVPWIQAGGAFAGSEIE